MVRCLQIDVGDTIVPLKLRFEQQVDVFITFVPSIVNSLTVLKSTAKSTMFNHDPALHDSRNAET